MENKSGIKTKNLKMLSEVSAQDLVLNSADSSFSFMAREYHELKDQPMIEKSQLETFQDNIQRLEDLVFRLSFISKENRYILKQD